MARKPYFSTLFVLILASYALAEVPIKVEVVQVKKIWDKAPHNAFTDLARWHDAFYCAFREGRGHVSTDGKIRILESKDANVWASTALVSLEGFDLRDAHLSVTPDGRLMLLGGAAPREKDNQSAPTGTFVSFSKDGRQWTQPKIAVEPGRWLWCVTWHEDKAYGVSYTAGKGSERYLDLLVSDDGIHYKQHVPRLLVQGYPTEVTLRFDSEGTCYALVRRDRHGNDPSSALLGISRPDYKQWQWKDLGSDFNGFGGPNFIQTPDGFWLAAGRMHDGGAHTALCYLNVESGKMTRLIKLPSGGDTSYPGMVWHNNMLYISYYSSHESKTSIYLAKVKVHPETEITIGEDKPALLETVRAMVARNETLLNPIKMAYMVKKSRTGERPQPLGGSRRPGRSISHVNYIWAQDGEKNYIRQDSFYGPNEPARCTVKVFEPERDVEGILPDLMEGYISPRDRRDWNYITMAKLGLRPMGGDYTLSQILVPKYASIHRRTETIDGQETYVIDARLPYDYPYFARMWIDRQRGMPLRIKYFRRHPNWNDAKVISQINDIKLHQLPNGAWIPVEGVRSNSFSDEYISYEHIIVDVNSITTRREDIPESLFKIDFPKGAVIYNAISGLTTVQGQKLKTYEQIVNADGTYIAGTVVNGDDSPVSGVVVGPLAIRTKQNIYKLIQGSERLCAVTDAKGRFAIELEKEGQYDLWVFPDDFVDMRVRGVPLGRHDLKITLSKGGTVTGCVMHLLTGGKVPVADVEVSAERGQGVSITTLRRHRMRTETDTEGRFQIKYLDTLMPKRGTRDSAPTQYVPRVWQIRCGSTTQNVLFEDDKNTQHVELVLEPDLREAVPLIDRALPDFKGIKINLVDGQTKEKMMLICFFDMNQRPSRNYITQLANQVEILEQKGISLAAVQAVRMDENALSKWISENNISFPVGMIQNNEECVRFDWAVCSLPWLILTDRKHVVTAEGFNIGELDHRIGEILD